MASYFLIFVVMVAKITLIVDFGIEEPGLNEAVWEAYKKGYRIVCGKFIGKIVNFYWRKADDRELEAAKMPVEKALITIDIDDERAFKNKYFCPFHTKCATPCELALTPLIKMHAARKKQVVAQFNEKPECFKPKDNEVKKD